MSTIKGFKDTIKWYDTNATDYANAAKNLPVTPQLDKFVSLLPSFSEVLDAGCGSGRDSRLLKSKGFDVTGIDISKGLITEARKESPDIKFILGDLLNLPFPDKSFSAVWSFASLVHLETSKDTQKAINEFNRVLKKDGIVFIFVKEQLTDKKTAVVTDKLSHHDRFFQYYSKDEITNMLTAARFKILFIQNNVIDPADREDTKWIWILAKKTAE